MGVKELIGKYEQAATPNDDLPPPRPARFIHPLLTPSASSTTTTTRPPACPDSSLHNRRHPGDRENTPAHSEQEPDRPSVSLYGESSSSKSYGVTLSPHPSGSGVTAATLGAGPGSSPSSHESISDGGAGNSEQNIHASARESDRVALLSSTPEDIFVGRDPLPAASSPVPPRSNDGLGPRTSSTLPFDRYNHGPRTYPPHFPPHTPIPSRTLFARDAAPPLSTCP